MKTMLLTGVICAMLAAGNPSRAAEDAGPAAVPAALSPAAAPTNPPARAPMTPGKIMAIIVVGDAQLVDSAGQRKPLVKGQTFGEGNTVLVGPQGSVTLACSNGAVLLLKQNGQLAVDKFQQAPFNDYSEGSYMRLTHDPSQSVIELDLRDGTLECEVKKLDLDAGSTFAVKTPAGSFSVRGTMFALAVVHDKDGGVAQVVGSCLLGELACRSAGNNYAVPGGGQIQFAPAANGPANAVGFQVSGAALPNRMAEMSIMEIYWAINVARTESGFGRLIPDAAPPTPPADLPAAPPLPIDPSAPSA